MLTHIEIMADCLYREERREETERREARREVRKGSRKEKEEVEGWEGKVRKGGVWRDVAESEVTSR